MRIDEQVGADPSMLAAHGQGNGRKREARGAVGDEGDGLRAVHAHQGSAQSLGVDGRAEIRDVLMRDTIFRDSEIDELEILSVRLLGSSAQSSNEVASSTPRSLRQNDDTAVRIEHAVNSRPGCLG